MQNTEVHYKNGISQCKLLEVMQVHMVKNAEIFLSRLVHPVVLVLCLGLKLGFSVTESSLRVSFFFCFLSGGKRRGIGFCFQRIRPSQNCFGTRWRWFWLGVQICHLNLPRMYWQTLFKQVICLLKGKKDRKNVSWCWLTLPPHPASYIVKPKVVAFKQLNVLSLLPWLKDCGHSGSSNFEKMTRLHPNNNRIPLFMLATPTAFCSFQDSPRRRNCLTSLLLNNLIKQKKKCQLLPTSEKQRFGGREG